MLHSHKTIESPSLKSLSNPSITLSCFPPQTFHCTSERDLLTTLDWLVKMAYWSSYDTTENSSSDVQWTVIVSYEAVHNSSRITGGFGAAIGKTKTYADIWRQWSKLSGCHCAKQKKQQKNNHNVLHRQVVVNHTTTLILMSVIKMGCSSSSYCSNSPHTELNTLSTTGTKHQQSNLFYSAESNAYLQPNICKLFCFQSLA